MAAKTVADDGEVYMAFNAIIQGQDSQIRKLPSIKRLVRKHKQQPQIARLLKEHGETVICDQLRRLLESQVFESTDKAKCEFPELFEVSQAQCAERAISEAEAVEDHEKAIEEALASSDSHDIPYESDSDSGRTVEALEAKASLELPRKNEQALLGVSVPSLFPLEFEFVIGYKILVKTQQVLEFACFRFAKKVMPEILEKRKWHCPESAELNQWAHEFLKRLKKFEKGPSRPALASRPLKELFPSIKQIRHHAVHRIPVTAKELEQFMADGEILVQLFEDSTAISVMARARSEVQKAVAEMEKRKNMLEARLAEVLRDIADKRAELDRIEAEAIANTQKKDKEYQLFAGTQLQETVWLDDSVIGDGHVATQNHVANGVDDDSLLDHLRIALEPDNVSIGKSKTKDVAERSMPSALGETCIEGSNGQGVPGEVEEARDKSPEPADADGDADGAGIETKRREISSNTSEIVRESEASEHGWHISRILGIKRAEK